MTSQEQAQKIEEIYNETIAQIKSIEKEQKKIITDYIKKLELEKIEQIRKSLTNS